MASAAPHTPGDEQKRWLIIQEKSCWHLASISLCQQMCNKLSLRQFYRGGGVGGSLEALNQMSPLFITSKKKSFSSTSTAPTLNPTQVLDIENQNHVSLKSVESYFTSLVALVLLSLSPLSVFRCPASSEKMKYQVTLHFWIIMVQLSLINFWNSSFTFL